MNWTVHEVSEKTGVSIRALQYYDRIGLLAPAGYTEAGYRLYDEASLERLQQILLLRELEFPLKDIRAMLKSPDFDREKALEQQIELLTLKKEHLEGLIAFARNLRKPGGKTMEFDAFDKSRLEEYAAQAKAAWGHTEAYREYEQKSRGRISVQQEALSGQMMEIFREFGKIRDQDPAGDAAQALVETLRGFITEHYYTCTPEILAGLGRAYGAGGAFTENIDAAAGSGTARFAARAIGAYCS